MNVFCFSLKKVVAHATELNLSTNQLKSLPDYFSGFSKLMYLNLSVNMLSSLPQEMDNLQCLRELVISNNRCVCCFFVKTSESLIVLVFKIFRDT